MKFKALSTEFNFTENKTYFGQIVLDHSEGLPDVQTLMMVVIFNDEGFWEPYPVHYFVPVDA